MNPGLIFIVITVPLTLIFLFIGHQRARKITYLLEKKGLSVLLSGSSVLQVNYEEIKWIKIKYSRPSGPLIEVWGDNLYKSSVKISVYYGITELVITPDEPKKFVAAVRRRMYRARHPDTHEITNSGKQTQKNDA